MAGRLGLTVLAITITLAASAGLAIAQQAKVSADIIDKARSQGTVRVIVRLNVAVQLEGNLPSRQAVVAQRQTITTAQSALLTELAGVSHKVTGRVDSIPVLGLEVGLVALAVLERSPRVLSITLDHVAKPLLYESVPLIQADQAWAAGFDGTGWVVAVLDTGVDSNHPFLTGKVVAEACFTSNNSCPDGSNMQIAPGAGAPCTYNLNACSHGTHVAGIVAGQGPDFSGVASGAKLVAIQVFSRDVAGPVSFTMDQILALHHVFTLSGTLQIAAVNMSLGCHYTGQPNCVFTDQAACDADATGIKMAIDHLRQAGIATVIAAGNDGFGNQISTPGCISTAVSVGSTTKSDAVSTFSNWAPFLSLLAPGGDGVPLGLGNICSSIPAGYSTPFGSCRNAGGGGTFWFDAGTSMAAPHVAGAWAILKQSAGADATVPQILNALQTRGLQIADNRDPTNPNPLNGCRIQVLQAVNNLPPRYAILDTPATGINNCGQMIGRTGNHGFLLSGGNLTTFDAPGATNYTNPYGINNSGQIVGNYQSDQPFVGFVHGFLRSPDGSFTTIDPPGANGLFTAALGINNSGQIVGSFADSAGKYHGFLLSGGTYTIIDAGPDDANTGLYGINDAGQIVGYFNDRIGGHGFLRSPDGSFTPIEVPGAEIGTAPYGINASGLIVGSYGTSPSSHGFLRLLDGTFITIDAPGANFTGVAAINDSGQIAGAFGDASGFHSFLDLSDPQFAPVRRPLAAAVPVGLR